MMAVLVTGGAGYIGSHACKALAEAGFLPIAYDNLGRGHRDLVKWGPLEIGRIGDRGRLDQVLERWHPIAAMHFAALAEVGESVRDPLAYYRNNVAETIGLVEALMARGIKAMVFSSTCATYGLPETMPIDETIAQAPINPYGRTKLMVETMLRDVGAAHDFRWAALRYFNACGADPDSETGEDHDPETHLIPRALLVAAGRMSHLDVFGTDYPTPDGTCIRDYIHVSDLAAMHVAALARLLVGEDSMALNLGTGQGHSIREVIASVERVTGRRLMVKEGPRRAGDPPCLVADCRQAKTILGIEPRFSAIDDIVASAWAWHQIRHGLTETPIAAAR